MIYEVRFSKRAQADLISIHDYIAQKSDESIALGYFERIRDYCLALSRFPARGRSWDYVFKGVRTIGFERRVSIAFRIKEQTVTIVRVLYGGRDVEGNLKKGRAKK